MKGFIEIVHEVDVTEEEKQSHHEVDEVDE